MPAEIIEELVPRLAGIPGVVAVALGGSRASGTHRPDSDIDLGLYYRDAGPFAIADIRALADELNDTPEPTVSDFYRWGPWVNGGAWLTIGGQGVDFLYRSVDRLERVIDDCRRGVIESDYYQQPPYGFHSYVYLGELSICRPLHDPAGALAALKERLVPYPPPLKRAIVSRFLWAAEFDLAQAVKLAAQGDVYAAAGCFSRVASHLVQIACALNERYFVSDKGALDEMRGFGLRPPALAETLVEVLSGPGSTPSELGESASRLSAAVGDLIALAGNLYERPTFRA